MHQIKRTLPLTIVAGDDLYNTIRAALIIQGSSLNAWCIANNVNRQTAEKSLKGQRHGRRASALREQLIAEFLLQGEYA